MAVEVQNYGFLTSAVDGGKNSASRSGRVTSSTPPPLVPDGGDWWDGTPQTWSKRMAVNKTRGLGEVGQLKSFADDSHCALRDRCKIQRRIRGLRERGDGHLRRPVVNSFVLGKKKLKCRIISFREK
jgi:hypothetical protein